MTFNVLAEKVKEKSTDPNGNPCLVNRTDKQIRQSQRNSYVETDSFESAVDIFCEALAQSVIGFDRNEWKFTLKN